MAWNLISKDLSIAKKYVWIGFAYAAAVLLLLGGNVQTSFAAAAIGLNFFFTTGVAQQEVKQDGDALLQILPYGRGRVALNRYLATLLLFLLCGALQVGIALLLLWIMPDSGMQIMTPLAWLLSFCALCLNNALVLPLQFNGKYRLT